MATPDGRVRLERIYARYHGLCHICEQWVEPSEAVSDHIVPLARGGVDAEPNLALAHTICNSRKGTRLMGELPTDRAHWRYTNAELRMAAR
jgi:5-methylcytosine-specific restriction endonuclease McrA